MAQITQGLRSVLSNPFVYNLFQRLMGAHRGRLELVEDYIRPFSGMRVLDIGCGTAEILEYLPDDVEYFGYDISREYISAAKVRFGERGVFHCGLFDQQSAYSIPPPDVVLMTGVLHHLDDNVVRSLLLLIRDVMKDDGRLITKDPCFSDRQNPIARFLISQDRGQNVRAVMDYKALASSAFSRVNGSLKHRSWIPYTHWIMECVK